MKAALAAGGTAFFLYHIFAAAGPIYTFGSAFPLALPKPSSLAPVAAGLAVPDAPRNCMPSVHFTCAILIVAESRNLDRAWRVAFFIFAACIGYATIALGEHYLIDLIVALPFTCCVLALVDRKHGWVVGWRKTALCGGVFTVCWLVFLRYWTPPSHVSAALWLMTAATLAGSALLLRRSDPRRKRHAWARYRGAAPGVVS